MITTSSTKLRKSAFSNAELIHQLKLRNEEAFSQVYDAYSAALLYSINKMTRDIVSAEKILQLVFEKIVLTIHGYSPGNASLFSWMSLIARNETMDFIKTQQATGPGRASSFDENKMTVFLTREPQTIPLDKTDQLAITPQLQRVMSELYNRGFSSSEIDQVLCLQPYSVKKQ